MNFFNLNVLNGTIKVKNYEIDDAN